MNLTRCNQGHFYDSDRFDSCPHCNDQAGAPAADNAEQKTVPSTPPQHDTPTAKLETPTPAASVAASSTPSLRNDVEDVQHTVSINIVKKGKKAPVVGWLVCVEGEHFGEDFRIQMGRNFIGRSNDMDIVLANDKSISRDKHCIIVYEPKGNMFIVQAGDSKELSYLNDRVILSPQELQPYDTLKLGNSTLLFVPFCSANFQWQQDKDDENK